MPRSAPSARIARGIPNPDRRCWLHVLLPVTLVPAALQFKDQTADLDAGGAQLPDQLVQPRLRALELRDAPGDRRRLAAAQRGGQLRRVRPERHELRQQRPEAGQLGPRLLDGEAGHAAEHGTRPHQDAPSGGFGQLQDNPKRHLCVIHVGCP